MITASDMKLRRALASLALVLALALPAGAVAQGDPTATQYEGAVAQVGGELGAAGEGTGPAAVPPTGLRREVVSGLPFTGLDAVSLAIVALALTGMGFALRRLTFADDA